MGLGGVTDEAETDADAAGFAAEFGAAAVELFEDPFVVGFGDARALVVDRELEVCGFGGGEADGDGGSGRGMFEGVVDEVDEGLMDGGSVPVGFGQGGGVIGEFGSDEDVGGGGGGFHESDGFVDQADGVDGFELVFLAALLDPGVVEDVGDEAGEATTFLDDEVEVFLLLGGAGDGFLFEAFGEESDGGDGGAEFVGDAGDEGGLHFGELELAVEGAAGVPESEGGGGGGGGDEESVSELAAADIREEQFRAGERELDAEVGALGGGHGSSGVGAENGVDIGDIDPLVIEFDGFVGDADAEAGPGWESRPAGGGLNGLVDLVRAEEGEEAGVGEEGAIGIRRVGGEPGLDLEGEVTCVVPTDPGVGLIGFGEGLYVKVVEGVAAAGFVGLDGEEGCEWEGGGRLGLEGPGCELEELRVE